MPELPDQMAPRPSDDALADRLREIPGLTGLVAEAEATWRARAAGGAGQRGTAGRAGQRGTAGEPVDAGKPGWRTFEDAFPTFYEFTNRPR
jgi:hypothetical protein